MFELSTDSAWIALLHFGSSMVLGSKSGQASQAPIPIPLSYHIHDINPRKWLIVFLSLAIALSSMKGFESNPRSTSVGVTFYTGCAVITAFNSSELEQYSGYTILMIDKNS
ncbi:hypothetical protein TNCV_1275021 [Trichonephila clavipes]|nr:hypothetical protein TNCV_1275021 [Trichonephila clavipes]